MASFSARRFRSVCAISAIALVALALPGIASAKKSSCNGQQEFVGAGSTLQKTAQVSVWGPGFGTSAVGCPSAVPGEKPKLKEYKSIGSGPGMEEWGLEGHAFEATTSFVATDEAPNVGQLAQLDTATESTIETIPVLQAAVAVIVHLPTGCTASSTVAGDTERLVLTNETLRKIWNGTISTWGGIVSAETSSGDAVAPAGCEAETIKKWVRDEESGTTHIFKKYLSLIKPGEEVEYEAGKKATWTALSEGELNTKWPLTDSVVKSGNTKEPNSAGGGNLVEATLSVPSSIGYAALTDARAKEGKKLTITGEFEEVESPVGSGKFVKVGNGETYHPGTGGAGKATFWTPIQNGASTFADPSVDNETSATATKSNCENENYTNGVKTFPPKKTTQAWNEVTTATTEPKYSICGLTFDLAPISYTTAKFGVEGPNIEKTVGQYYRYEISPVVGGGQEAIGSGHDYEALTSQLDTIATKGAKKLK